MGAAGPGPPRLLRVGWERTFETEVWRDVLVGIYFLKLDRQLRSQRELLLVCRHVSS
jgi:hypothetical protein